jgi:positive regulator of sigma E activity
MSSVELVSTRARVFAVHPDALVDVELIKAARCKGCEGSCTWFNTTDLGTLKLRAANTLTVGQSVQVMLPARYILFAAALLHGLPLAALLLGALTGAFAGGTDLSCLAGAAAGFVAALLLTPTWHRCLEVATSKQFRVAPEP